MTTIANRSPASQPQEDDPSSKQSLRDYLRSGTAAEHRRVDDMFGHLDLKQKSDYIAFVSAHARAVPALERALEEGGIERILSDWPARRRRQRLIGDMALLGAPMPPTLDAPALIDEAALWGAVYVLEGSKLGGAFLAKSVPEAWPTSYLRPQEGGKGEMKRFMDRLDATFLPDPSVALDAAIAVFALFSQAARLERELPVS